ncbi:hypothetical protein HY36_04180 [Hyphomonas atlantica]|uniref:Uncharacterized protein n=1 Tax=Hyphomonas atlantica TaxID=1280948 RepID=A0A059E256_9PROT|nr:hypothetical protein HY36_04180 [Hyphomonas atlantica]
MRGITPPDCQIGSAPEVEKRENPAFGDHGIGGTV